ncbi:MAG: hypothetical protein KGL39_13125 [Patescibacteria group bacterium]|nr:hypothetical protein [Patescibacteria group bacterium]
MADEKKNGHAAGKTAWQCFREIVAKRGEELRVFVIVTDYKHQLGEKLGIGQKFATRMADLAVSLKMRPVVNFMMTSGDTVESALQTLGAEEKDIGAVVVSPHAPQRKETINRLREKKWLQEEDKIADDAYVVCDLYNTCTGKDGVCDDSCGRHRKGPTKITMVA